MPQLTAILATLALVLVPVVTPFAIGRTAAARVEARMALLGAVAYLTFCFFLGNGLGGALRSVLTYAIPGASDTIVVSASYAAVTALLLPLAHWAVTRLFLSGAPTPDETVSLGYGMAIAQIVLMLFSPVATYAIVAWHRAQGTLGAWAAGIAGDATAAQVESLVAYYEALTPAYGLFLALAVVAVMAFHLLVSVRMAEAALVSQRGFTAATVLVVAAFSLLYQLVPSVPGIGYLLGCVLCAVFAAVAVRGTLFLLHDNKKGGAA